MTVQTKKRLRGKDFETDQEVRWCPGCGDYSILKQTQAVFADLEIDKHNAVFISGIGCSSRFPYYMETYGMHSIHGRATAVASGLKAARPDLDVWIITGDGDSLSIGGNHLIHLLRRNFNVNILLFNNEIYGLTKGQYSPTSPEGTVTKSTPLGSIDHPFNPLSLALGADATFIARTIDRDPKLLKDVLKEGHKHKGSSFIEIYQNCNVFNDGAFSPFTDKDTKADTVIQLEHERPLLFGKNNEKGIWLDGTTPRVVDLEKDKRSMDELWVHNKHDKTKAFMLTQLFEDPSNTDLPRPFGIVYQEERFCYEDAMHQQIQEAKTKKGEGDLDKLLRGSHTWQVV